MDNKKAIVFDFDGVITDGIPFHDQAYSKTFETYGLNVPLEELHSMIGSTSKQVFEKIFSSRDLATDPEEASREHAAMLFNLYKEKAEMPEGLVGFLQHCKEKGLHIGLSSSTHSNILKAVLEKFQISNYFTAVVGGEGVSKGKPDPEMILKALDVLNVQPEDAIAIDDAKSGILAAKSINMYAIAYLNYSKIEIPQADINVYNFEEITSK